MGHSWFGNKLHCQGKLKWSTKAYIKFVVGCHFIYIRNPSARVGSWGWVWGSKRVSKWLPPAPQYSLGPAEFDESLTIRVYCPTLNRVWVVKWLSHQWFLCYLHRATETELLDHPRHAKLLWSKRWTLQQVVPKYHRCCYGCILLVVCIPCTTCGKCSEHVTRRMWPLSVVSLVCKVRTFAMFRFCFLIIP